MCCRGAALRMEISSNLGAFSKNEPVAKGFEDNTKYQTWNSTETGPIMVARVHAVIDISTRACRSRIKTPAIWKYLCTTQSDFRKKQFPHRGGSKATYGICSVSDRRRGGSILPVMNCSVRSTVCRQDQSTCDESIVEKCSTAR